MQDLGLMIVRATFLTFVVLVARSSSAAPETIRGLWLTPRQSTNNQARADVVGDMQQAPEEVWQLDTGGSIAFARDVRIGEETAALIFVGSVLELRRWSGESIWRNARSGIGSVLCVANFDGRGDDEICVTTDSRTVMLLDMGTGRELWRWKSEDSTFISGYKFYKTSSGIRFICFPSYSLDGYCIDFTGRRERPRLVWQRNYAGKYAAGYGPSIVLKDMDGDNEVDIVLSGKIEHVYQAVIDIDTGKIKSDIYYEPEPGSPVAVGRPYGLLRALPLTPGRPPDIVTLSCQVEEYVGIARNDGAGQLRRMWGKYVEKDWPEDHFELRPQITSLTDLRGKGDVELVVGLWDGARWSTCIIDPRQGFEARRGTLDERYFWGCHDFDGDGSDEIIVSREKNRRTARSTTLEVLSGKTLQPMATLDEAAILFSSDSSLPDDTSFAALRRNPLFLETAAGKRGILVRRFSGSEELGTYFWPALDESGGEPRRIAGPGIARADLDNERLLLSDAKGGVQRYDGNLHPIGQQVVASGRTCQPLVWAAGGVVELIVDVAGGSLVGGAPDIERNGQFRNPWRIRGTMASTHIDVHGQSRLVAADLDDADRPAVLIYRGPINSGQVPERVPLEYPPYLGVVPYGQDFHVLVNLQTGVHTMALAAYDAAGRLQWEDSAQGAHPRLPAAADLDGDGRYEVIADDHGLLRVYNGHGAVMATDKGWPPAYTIPIIGPFRRSGETCVLRASGIAGITLIDGHAQPVWQTVAPTWRHYGSLAAVADIDGQGEWCAGSLAEDGRFECIELATGAVRWSLDLHAAPNATSIIAGNLNRIGGEEFLLGLPDGRLVCLTEEQAGTGTILWQKTFDAAVSNPIIADLDQDGSAEIILSTSDGQVRILD